MLITNPQPSHCKRLLLEPCWSEDVESGTTLSDSMAKHPKAFDRLYSKMVNAGEIGGVLDVILQRLADFLEKGQRLRRRIKGAMIYGIMGAAVWGWLVGAYDPYNDYLAGGAGWGAIEATAPAIGDIVSMPSLPEETLMAAFGPEGMGAAGDHMGDFLLVMIAFLFVDVFDTSGTCLLYTSPSPRDATLSRMPSSA